MVVLLADNTPVWYVLPLCLVGLLSLYIIYQRHFHPLAKYPGDFIASITDLTKLSYFWSLNIDQKILKLHQQHGPIVRIAPNELSFWGPDAVSAIYKSGRIMQKSSFFDGFTTFTPNLFGNRDEDVHSLRRRQMAHGFSTASLTAMEKIFNRHIKELRLKLDAYAESGEKFDLKKIIAFYGYDILGELAFDIQFEAQVKDDEEYLPPINDHIFLGCLYGSMPFLLPYTMKLSKYIPIPWLQGLIRSRTSIRNTVKNCVMKEMKRMNESRHDTINNTLLTKLIQAKDPETGQKLTTMDICSEAFGFLVAGSHTTSSTLTLLFYHILHNSGVYSAIVEEMTRQLPFLEEGAYPHAGLENKLPYTMACVRENFRFTPVFTMPLTRTVVAEKGVEVSGEVIPQGTNVSITNYALHHNPNIWGADCDKFNPYRWLTDGYSKRISYLMPFGAGHRMCIGRNIAMINILKVTTAVLRNYELEPVDKGETLKIMTVGLGEKEGSLWCYIKKRN